MKDIPKWLTESLSQSPGFSNDNPMPDIHTDECDATVPHLKVLDLSLMDVHEGKVRSTHKADLASDQVG